MSRSKKIWLGICSLLPLLLLIVYLIIFFNVFINVFRQAGNQEMFPELIFNHIIWIVLFGMAMAIAKITLLIYFLIHAINNPRVESNERIIWILVFIFAGSIGFPIYWYLRIWQAPPAMPPAQPGIL